MADDYGLHASEMVEFGNRDHWIEGRLTSIGSSDAATIMGYGYSGMTRYGLWAEKAKGLSKDFKEDMRKRFAKGHAAEPYLAELCRIDHGWEIRFDPKNSFRRSKEIPYLSASLDGWMVEDSEHVAVEFKNVSLWESRSWDVKSGKAPLKYALQLQHQMAVTGWSKGYLVALVGYETHPIPVYRHDDLIQVMLEEYAEFHRLVVNGIEPEADGSDATHRAASRVHKPVPRKTKTLTQSETEVIDECLELEKRLDEIGERHKKRATEVVSIAGDAELIVTSDGRWYQCKSMRGGPRRLKPYRRGRR